MVIAIIGVVLLLVAVVLVFVRRSQQARILEIGSTETRTAQELEKAAAYVATRLGEHGSYRDIAEVKGTLRCDSPITSEVAGQPCAYYRMEVRREYEESYWETDSQTKHRVRRTRRATERVAFNSRGVPFWVEDATGRIMVQPDGADVDAVKAVDRFEPSNRQGGFGAGLRFGNVTVDLGGFGSNTIGYHVEERVLPLDRRLYVLGEANDSSGTLAIQKPSEKGRKFIISVRSEEELLSSARSAVTWLTVGAAASGVVGVVLIGLGLLR